MPWPYKRFNRVNFYNDLTFVQGAVSEGKPEFHIDQPPRDGVPDLIQQGENNLKLVQIWHRPRATFTAYCRVIDERMSEEHGAIVRGQAVIIAWEFDPQYQKRGSA